MAVVAAAVVAVVQVEVQAEAVGKMGLLSVSLAAMLVWVHSLPVQALALVLAVAWCTHAASVVW